MPSLRFNIHQSVFITTAFAATNSAGELSQLDLDK
jgi:hypothetical protein